MRFAEFELTKEFRDRFQQAVDEHDALFIQESLRDVNSADVTSLLYEFVSFRSRTTKTLDI